MDKQDQYSEDSSTDTAAARSDAETTQFDTISSDSGSTGADTGEQIKSTVGDTVQQVQDTAGRVASQAQDTVGNVVDQVKQTASSRLVDQKSRAAQSIAQMADTVHQVSGNLDADSPIASYANNAAWQLQQVSNYLQEKDLRELVTEVEHFARRQPTLFLTGGFLLGVLGARFLKSSASQLQAQQQSGSRYTASLPSSGGSTASAARTGGSSGSGGGSGSRELTSFTTQGNYTVENKPGTSGYAGAGTDGDADQDGGTTIHSTYVVDTRDTSDSEA